MIFDREIKNVYIYCPARVVTGGAECLHQFGHVLNESGKSAFMVYYGETNPQIPSPYLCYNLKIAEAGIDSEESAIVLFEAIFDKIMLFKKAKIIFWWLSVDNFYLCSREYLNVKDYFKRDITSAIWELIYRIAKRLSGKHIELFNEITVKYLAQADALNCYQSEYAQNFLINHGFRKMLPLIDYINTDFISTSKTTYIKENKILYNPKKGLKATKTIMKQAPHFKWVPLENMSRAQLIREMNTSKVYIDFGYHPGRDKIPREAALCGCCIITNKKGSARIFEDVSIFDEYKFDSTIATTLVINKIQDIFQNYEAHNKNFEFYRSILLNEKARFIKQTYTVFGLSK